MTEDQLPPPIKLKTDNLQVSKDLDAIGAASYGTRHGIDDIEEPLAQVRACDEPEHLVGLMLVDAAFNEHRVFTRAGALAFTSRPGNAKSDILFFKFCPQCGKPVQEGK